MSNFIEKIQQKSKATRLKILWFLVAVIMMVIVSGWVVNLGQRLSLAGQGDILAIDDDSSKFNQVKEEIKEAPSLFSSLKKSFKGILGAFFNSEEEIDQINSVEKTPERPMGQEVINLKEQNQVTSSDQNLAQLKEMRQMIIQRLAEMNRYELTDQDKIIVQNLLNLQKAIEAEISQLENHSEDFNQENSEVRKNFEDLSSALQEIDTSEVEDKVLGY